MFAVIKTGGKQYITESGKKLKVEKLDAQEGRDVVFDQVLLTANGDKTEIGMPLVKGAKVEAKILKQGRAKKVIVFKYRPKARHRVKKGHRQHYTEVEITRIATQ